jgi:hypothetical protein
VSNAIKDAVASRIQQQLDAQLSAIKVTINANGWILSQMVDVYTEAVSRLGVLADTKDNRAKATDAGQQWESFRFTGRKAFAKAHTKVVDTKTKKVSWLYNAAGAAEAIVEFENASKVLAFLEGLQDQVASKLK